jgi:hypothetical protein
MNSEQMKTLGIIEVFLPIDDFPNYEVSNYGNVRNRLNNKLLNKHLSGLYYAVELFNNSGKELQMHIHKLVTNAFLSNNENKKCVNFIDKNKLNCCEFNLRYATYSENQGNQLLSRVNTSGVKGVTWNKRVKKWHAQIRVNGKTKSLGLYDSIEDAKKARQKKARELFGEYINKCEL